MMSLTRQKLHKYAKLRGIVIIIQFSKYWYIIVYVN